jgi:hypothetical protein
MTGDDHDIVRRRPRFSRESPIALRLTDDDLAIIRAVAKHRFLRSTHFQRLLPHRSPRKLLERLGELYHAGVLDRPRAQINYHAQSGSAPIVYALGNQGAEAVTEVEHQRPPITDWTDKNREAKRPYIEHALLLADLMLPLELSSSLHPGIKFIDAQTLAASLPAGTIGSESPWTLTARLIHHGRPHIVSLVPDAVFALEFGDPNSRSYFFVEADRATMPIMRSDHSQSCYRRKLIAYFTAHKAGQHIARFAFPNLRVLTLTTSAQRIASMLDAVRQVTAGRGSGMFLFADATTLSAPNDPSTAAWLTSAGQVRLDTPPRTFPLSY